MLILSSDGLDLVDVEHLTIVEVEGGFRIVDRGHFAGNTLPLYLSKLYPTLQEAKDSLKYFSCCACANTFFFSEVSNNS